MERNVVGHIMILLMAGEHTFQCLDHLQHGSAPEIAEGFHSVLALIV
jgi:hypothetical protein